MLFDKNKTSYTKGFLAERAASLFLERSGYKIVAHRFKTKYGEIDLIAADSTRNLILFIEVKERHANSIAIRDGEVISYKQIKRNCNAASYFLYCTDLGVLYIDYTARFDLIITIDGVVTKYIKNAWDTVGGDMIF